LPIHLEPIRIAWQAVFWCNMSLALALRQLGLKEEERRAT